jgi:tetratricopeptide (TPR) repeat protein
MALAQGKTEVVEDLTAELATAFPDAPSGWHWQVRQLLKQNRYPESLALAHQLEDYNLLGEIALAKGDTTLAQTYFRQALFFNSSDPAARFQLAQQAIAEGKSDEAIAYLKPITRPLLRPSTADSKFIYGYPADFPLYDSLLVITAPPLDGQPFYLLMQLYLEQGQTALAEEVKQALATYEPYPLN